MRMKAWGKSRHKGGAREPRPGLRSASSLVGQRRQSLQKKWRGEEARSRQQMRICAYQARNRENVKEGEVRTVRCYMEVMSAGEWVNAHRFRDTWVTIDFSLGCVGGAMQVKGRLEWVEAGVGGEEIDLSTNNYFPKFGCVAKGRREM